MVKAEATTTTSKYSSFPWSVTNSVASQGSGTLTLELPTGLSEDMFPLTFEVNASAQYAQVTIAGTTLGNRNSYTSSGEKDLIVDYDTYRQSNIVEFTYSPRARGTSYTCKFTLTLTCDLFESPDAITMTYSRVSGSTYTFQL